MLQYILFDIHSCTASNLSFPPNYYMMLVKLRCNSFAVRLGVFWLLAGGAERMWLHPPVPKQVDCLRTGPSMPACWHCVAWLGKLWVLNGDGVGLLYPAIMPAGTPVIIRLTGLGQVKLCSLTDTREKVIKIVTAASGVQFLFVFCLFVVYLCQIAVFKKQVARAFTRLPQINSWTI